MNRRTFLATLGSTFVAGCHYWPDDGFNNPCLATVLPEHLRNHELVQAAWEGIRPQWFWDCHVHLLGTGDAGSGAWISPEMQSPWHPVQRTQFRFYLNAACVAGHTKVDDGYLDRLIDLHDGLAPGSRLMLLAFDYHYNEHGVRQAESSAFHVPNDYAAEVVRRHPDRFEWVASVHPYRKDAVEALENAARAGARAIKWLPPAMGIDPGSPRCDAFYDAMVRLNVPLLTHGGEEKAVHGASQQSFANPLRLRRPLDHGVRVIVAHCASLGTSVDTDKGPNGPEVSNFALFERLMDEPTLGERFFGDISALTQVNRASVALKRVIERTDWHSRLINGSDYPLPGVMPLFSTRQLSTLGYVSKAEAEVITAIRRHNALLFDFVLKRTLRTGRKRLSAEIFESRRVFETSAA